MLKRLIPYLRPLWPRSTLAFICMALVAGIQTVNLWLMKLLIDKALNGKDIDMLKNGVILLLMALALKSILWYVHTYLSAYVGHTVSKNLRNDVYAHLYSLSMGFFNEKESSKTLACLTNDITALHSVLASTPTTIIRDGLTVIGLIGFILYSNFKFALLCLTIFPVAAILLTHLGKKSRKSGREGQARMADMYSTIQQSLLSMPIVKTFQNEQKEITEFNKRNQNYFNVIMRLVRIEAQSSPIMEFLGACVLSMMLWIGGQQVIHGGWSVGGFVSFIGAAMSLYNPLKQFASLNVKLQQGLAAGERVFELLDQKTTVIDSSHPTKISTLSKGVEFKNVTFSYPTATSQKAVQNINLFLPKGEITALVGGSGSGKSTLAQLMLRFYDPSEGEILMDDISYKNISLSQLRSQFAIVTQETILFNDSVLENIRYGKLTATDDEVKRAAKLAHADEFICKMSASYDTMIGERGARLSGGERQRLALARAILKDPSILILDEATSALDASSEEIVQLALDELLTNRTVLIIAHRFSTLRKANRIVVMDQGHITEIGTHQELIEKKGIYHKLHDLQSLSVA